VWSLLDNWNEGREEAYQLDTRELLNDLRTIDFSGLFSKGLAERLNYSPESLAFLERMLAEVSRDKKGEDPPVSFVLVWAYYFGETLVRNVPGVEWHEERIHDLRNFSVRVQQSNGYQEIKPVARILNLFMDPNRFPLSTVYETLMAMVTGEVDVMNAPEGQKIFYDKNGEYLFRLREGYTTPKGGNA
jgi:hypothetical protein